MNHAGLDDPDYDLYVLGALDEDQTEQISAHLREGCEYCLAKIAESQRLTAAMAGMADHVQPPQSLRRRVLASVAPPKPTSSWMYLAAGLAAACLVLIAFLIWSGRERSAVQDEMRGILNQQNQLRAALEMMSRPETRAVQFGNIPNGPRGRVFINRNGVVFVGTGLPGIPDDRTLELWLIPRQGAGAPQPAGVFRPDPNGAAVNIATNLANTNPAAVAVSVEPLGGVNAPTTKPILVIPLS